jgi:DNA-binding response OmpR family regulator
MTSPNRKALIIEDDRKQAKIFSQALTLAGFEAQIVRNGARAAALLQTETPDLILLDLHLPKVSGDKLLAQIRSSGHLGETKVIIATANPEKAYVLSEDSDMVLIKPISFNLLREVAARFFQE